jgi:hypothetical protein
VAGPDGCGSRADKFQLSAGVWTVPAHNYAICIATNSPGDASHKAKEEVREFLAKRVQAKQHKGQPD